MQQRYSRVFASLALAALFMPAAVAAQTSTSVDEQIKSLVSQIQALQMQLKTLLASNASTTLRVEGVRMQPIQDMQPMQTVTMQMMQNGNGMFTMAPGQMGKMMCVELNRNLRVGSQGDDVKKLQQMLSQDPSTGFKGQISGFFGPLTANAVAEFQLRQGIATTTDGTVGPMTRGFFQRACGKGLGGEMGPGMGGGTGTSMPGTMGMRIASVTGTITASSNTSMTVQTKDGNSRTVNITASTTIQVWTLGPKPGSVADLTVGTFVGAEGIPQTDGSLTARMIKVRVGGGDE